MFCISSVMCTYLCSSHNFWSKFDCNAVLKKDGGCPVAVSLGASPNVVFATWLQKPSANTIIIIYFGIITVSVNMQCVVFQRDTDTGCPLSVFIPFCSFQAGAGKTYIWSMDHHHVFTLALPSHFVLWRKIWKRMQGLWNWLYLIIML